MLKSCHQLPSKNSRCTRRATARGLSLASALPSWAPTGSPICTERHRRYHRETAREERIAHLAHHDPLTDLQNRAAFKEHLNAAVMRATQSGESFTLLAIDLDRLKEINDVFGHAVGDKLLASGAPPPRRRRGRVRRPAQRRRIQLIIDGKQPAPPEALAEQLHAAVAASSRSTASICAPVSPPASRYFRPTAPMPLRCSPMPTRPCSVPRRRRGTISFFEPEMDKRIRERRALHQDLRSRLRTANSAALSAAGAGSAARSSVSRRLLRWHHPQRGFVSPANSFRWPKRAGSSSRSANGFCARPAAKPRLAAAAADRGQPFAGPVPARRSCRSGPFGPAGNRPCAGRLELEITEGVLIEDFDRGLAILRRLKALGVRIAMDDFGTGYSSLSYLQSFPFDKIKIDRSFVLNLDRSSQSAAIIRAVIGLGRGLALPVIAEGVETAEQLAFLTNESVRRSPRLSNRAPAPDRRLC